MICLTALAILHHSAKPLGMDNVNFEAFSEASLAAMRHLQLGKRYEIAVLLKDGGTIITFSGKAHSGQISLKFHMDKRGKTTLQVNSWLNAGSQPRLDIDLITPIAKQQLEGKMKNASFAVTMWLTEKSEPGRWRVLWESLPAMPGGHALFFLSPKGEIVKVIGGS